MSRLRAASAVRPRPGEQSWQPPPDPQYTMEGFDPRPLLRSGVTARPGNYGTAIAACFPRRRFTRPGCFRARIDRLRLTAITFACQGFDTRVDVSRRSFRPGHDHPRAAIGEPRRAGVPCPLSQLTPSASIRYPAVEHGHALALLAQEYHSRAGRAGLIVEATPGRGGRSGCADDRRDRSSTPRVASRGKPRPPPRRGTGRRRCRGDAPMFRRRRRAPTFCGRGTSHVDHGVRAPIRRPPVRLQ